MKSPTAFVTVDGFTFYFRTKSSSNVKISKNGSGYGIYNSGGSALYVDIMGDDKIKKITDVTVSSILSNKSNTGKLCTFSLYNTCTSIEVTYVGKEIFTPALAQTSYTLTSKTPFSVKPSGVPKAYDGTITYRSNNETIAKVGSDGTVTPTGAKGEATITVTVPSTDNYAPDPTKLSCTVSSPIDFNITDVTIASLDDWKTFQQLVAGGNTGVNATMTANVSGVTESEMVGTTDRPYTGTFDGQGHTLTVNLSGSKNVAPFVALDGATIKNLDVQGEIYASGKFASGLASKVQGHDVNISGCTSGVTIHSSVKNTGALHGGIVSWTTINASVNITNCAFSGTIQGEDTYACGGIIGYPQKQSTITNCLVTATFSINPNKCNTFSLNENYAKVTNCYYTTLLGNKYDGATETTWPQILNGELLGELGSGWGQKLGSEMPTPFCERNRDTTNYVYNADGEWVCDDFEITDGTALPIGLDFTAKMLTNTRAFGSEGYYTVCLPYDLTVPEGTTYSSFSSVDDGLATARFTVGTETTLTAYQPYVLNVSNTTANLNGTNISVKAAPVSASSTTVGSASFLGTVSSISNADAAAASAYILQGDNLWHPVTTEYTAATIPAYRAYLSLPSASAKNYRFVVVDDATTDIRSIDTNGQSLHGAVYDLQGRKVADDYSAAKYRLASGIYIVNGKKRAIK